MYKIYIFKKKDNIKNCQRCCFRLLTVGKGLRFITKKSA